MVAGDKRRRARPPAPADARAPGSCSRPCSSCSRLWPRPPPRGPAVAGRVRVRRLWVPAVGAARGIMRGLHAVRGRWRRPRRAPLALARCRPWCVRHSRAARSHAPALGSRVPATCRMREPHWPRRLTRCSAGPTLRTSAGAPWPRVLLMRHCRSSRRRRVRPNRARLRRWVLQWCLLVACKPTHGRCQGKIQS